MEMFSRLFKEYPALGYAVCIAAWAAVFAAALFLLSVFKNRTDLCRRYLTPALAAGFLNLAAHLGDFFVTVRITPDLGLEANPLWLAAATAFGLKTAIWYGLTGKILLSIISFELYFVYLSGRSALYPREKGGLLFFFRNFGSVPNNYGGKKAKGLFNIFSFLFSLSGLYCFYVIFLNIAFYSGSPVLKYGFPDPAAFLIVYLAVLTAVYFIENYSKYRASFK